MACVLTGTRLRPDLTIFILRTFIKAVWTCTEWIRLPWMSLIDNNLYNDLSILSVHNTLNLDNDYQYIQSYKSQFNHIINYFNNNWNVLELPFYYTEPPFTNKYTNYRIIDDSIQILDYNEYLQNKYSARPLLMLTQSSYFCSDNKQFTLRAWRNW